MAIDQIRVSFNLNALRCFDEGDGPGNAEPFLWACYFKVDGDSVFVGKDLKLHGSATVVGTPGSHGNLPDDVDAGDSVAIPSALGSFSTTLTPIPTTIKGKTLGGLVGMLAVVLEEDSTSDHDIEVGHAALNTAVRNGINGLIQTLSFSKQEVTDEDIKVLESKISTAVEDAVSNEVDLFQGIASYVAFGNGQDDKIGNARYIGKYADLSKLAGTSKPLSWSWNNEGAWKMDGAVTVHKTATAAIMRSGDWASRLLFGRTTAQFVDQHQKFFDKDGLRLIQMDTYLDGNVRKWSGIYRSGTWAHRLRINRDQQTFLEETQSFFDKDGLRLEHMTTYVDNGVRRWAGSYRSGDWAHRLTVGRDAKAFATETQELFDKKGLRLEQAVTYLEGNVRRWAGIYRSGDWKHRFTMDRDTKTFVKETQEFFDKEGLRLTGVERYDQGGQPRWAGIYRSGDWGHRFIIDRGVESMLSETQDAFDKKGLRLVWVDVYQI